MLTVKRNHFYKKKEIETGVNVRPKFSDLPSSTATTATLGTKRDENIFVMSTTVPELPDYGDAEQVGATISLYTSAVDVKNNRSEPQIVGYKLNEDLSLAEGGISLSAKGDRLGLYSVHPINPTPYLEEEFEGAPEDIETINRMGTNNVITSTKAYITIKNLQKMMQRVTGESCQRVSWRNFIKQIETIDGEYDGSYRGFTGHKCRVSWVDQNHTRYKITPGYNRLLWKTKYYKYFSWEWTDLSIVEYEHTRAAAGSLESTPQATKGNTIFDDFYATRNFSNPYDANESDPLIMSHIDLSSENSLNGGQSLRFYHNWGYSPYNSELQTQIGSEKNLNPQTSRVSLYDIPFPSLPFDFARTTMDSESTEPVLGDTRGVVPEIRIPMNISKLPPNIYLAGEAYTGTDGTIDPPIASLKRFYGSTTTADAASPSYTTSGPASKYENTFLRSICVTFSNYKPKPEHTTVDKFLTYGLRNFYRGKNYDNIVGGFVITRYGIDGLGENNGNCYAFPLPVSRVPQYGAYASGTNSNDYTSINAGMAKFEGDGVMANLDILTWGRGNNALGAPATDTNIRYVELPMNAWFTSRVFTDIYQHNNSGSYVKRPYSATSSDNPSYGSDGTLSDLRKRGAPMRVIFETDSANQDIVTVSGTTLIELDGSPVNSNQRNLPFLDIPFPIGDSSNSAAAIHTGTYSFADNPELYPKHMTIWVQNYPWVSGNIRQVANDETYDSMFYVGDFNVTTSGSAREVEMFVDSVKLLNYEPEIRNVTANNSNSSLVFESDKFLSPLNTRYDSGSSNQYWIGNSWVQSGRIDRIVSCTVDSSSTAVVINNPSEFDTTFLENASVNNAGVSMTDSTGKLGGTKTLSSINTLDTFTINSAPTGDGTALIRFQSSGTLLPRINKADLTEYNAGQAVVFGFNDDNDLPTGDHSTNASGYVLFNDFVTQDWSAMSTDVALPTKTQTQQGATFGGIYSQATASMAIDKLGGQLLGERLFTSGSSNSNISGASYKVDGGATASTNSIALGTGSNNDFISVDGFRQKGFVKVNFSGSSSNYAKWVKKENILLSTRVTNCMYKSLTNDAKKDGYSDNLLDNQLQVKNINIFNYFDTEEKYMLYLVGDADTTASKKTGLILDRTKPPVNNIIEFTNLTSFADDGTTTLVSENNLHRLMICPEKYTLSMLYDTPSSRIKRGYTSACTVSETPSMSSLSTVSGSTLNEFTFNYDSSPTGTGGATGLYKNIWSLLPDAENDTIITDRDYGYGAFDEETNVGGEFFKGPSYLDTYNMYKIKNFDSLEMSNLNIALYYSNDDGLEESVTIETDDSSTAVKRPTLYTEYKDLPPVIRDFTVSPAVNTLAQDYNYYDLGDSNLNAVRFNWTEENADDIWYRMLLVDSVPVISKYHKATAYVPLNEPVSDLNVAPPSGNIVAYNKTTKYSVTSSTAVTIGSDTRKIIDGQGGYALQLANTTNGKLKITGNTNMPLFQTSPTEYTLVLHWTPSTADEGQNAIVFTVGSAPTIGSVGAGNLMIYKNTSDKIVFDINSTRITGNTVVRCDGSTPTSIIATYKSGSTGDDNKLYIDGKFDGSTTCGLITNNVNTLGGFHGGSNRGTTGFVEEFIVYHKCYDIVETSNEYLYNTEYLEDYDTSLLTHTGLLVAADYHNFRGTSKKTIGMSTPTSWRATIA